MIASAPAARPRRSLRRLIHFSVQPATFDFWASRLHRTWSWNRPLARVVGRRRESADAVTLVLRPNRHWRGFRAGQHLNVSAEIDGVRCTRSYSLSDAPRADRRIAITVKAVDGGRLSRHLCHTVAVGDVLELGPAFGDFALPPPEDGALLFLAAGSGITPLMALLRSLATQALPTDVTLLYWARTRAELCFVDELRALAAREPRLRVRFLLTREAATASDEGQGRIDAALLAAQVTDLAQRHVLACGPGGFVDSARALVGAQARSVQAEAFTPPPRRIDERGTAQVTLAVSGRTLTVPRGQSLLSALEAAGLTPASGCRMGICNTCACGKRSGSSRDLVDGSRSDEPLSALRLCVSAAASDLVLEL